MLNYTCDLNCISIDGTGLQAFWILYIQNSHKTTLLNNCWCLLDIQSKHPLQTTKENTLHMDITRWSNRHQIDYILYSQRWRGSIQSAKTTPGADCGSDHELFIVKFRRKLKKVGKPRRRFRYDLNQIPYDYTVKVTNRFKGLDLVDRVPEKLQMKVCNIVHEMVIKIIPKKKKCNKAKWLS